MHFNIFRNKGHDGEGCGLGHSELHIYVNYELGPWDDHRAASTPIEWIEWKRNDLSLEYTYAWDGDSQMLVNITRPEEKGEARAQDKKKKKEILRYSYSWEGDSEMMVNITKSEDERG